jgi:hypothetical protein
MAMSFELRKLPNLSDQLTDEDLDQVLALSGYFEIQWAAALHIVMDWKGLTLDDREWDSMGAWEISTRLQKRRRKLP